MIWDDEMTEWRSLQTKFADFFTSFGRGVAIALLACWLTLGQAAIAATAPSIQPYLDRVIENVTEFQLDNGLKFLVLERHQAPVVSFLTYADVGGADEPDGQTGVAHFLEHLAFKGTSRIGTVNYQAEQPLLDRLDRLYSQLRTARDRGNEGETAELQQAIAAAASEAKQFVKSNELGQIVEQAGGVGLNAATSADATTYSYSFPSNKLELWMSLESERFLDPVFREFETEKAVILEERRQRTDNSPVGQLVEVFLDKAFSVHPYRRPTIGYESDIRNLTRQNVRDFFDTYYVPANLTIAIVGDVNPTEVQRLAQTYFGRFPSAPKPKSVEAIEPPQQMSQEVSLSLSSQPIYLEGYHCPSSSSPDAVVYEILSSLLSDGRTSRLYSSLVETQKIALTAQGFFGFPGDKYPTLMAFYGITAPGHTNDELATALRTEIDRFKTELVDVADLDRVKNQLRASVLRSLDSNSGMARLLTEYEVKTGNWQNLFATVDEIATVTPADIQRVARATFRPENRTVGRVLPIR
ncbi:MAG: pitrilysin family protein [Cyanobacteria bacterium P01_D01_bin.123]